MKKLEIIFEAFLKDAVEHLAFPIGFINCSLFLGKFHPVQNAHINNNPTVPMN